MTRGRDAARRRSREDVPCGSTCIAFAGNGTYLPGRDLRGFASHADGRDGDVTAVRVEASGGLGARDGRDGVPDPSGDGRRAGGDGEGRHPGLQERPAAAQHEGVALGARVASGKQTVTTSALDGRVRILAPRVQRRNRDLDAFRGHRTFTNKKTDAVDRAYVPWRSPHPGGVSPRSACATGGASCRLAP